MIGTTGRFNDISTSPYDWWHRSSKMVTVSGSEDWDLEPVTTTLALVIPGPVPVLSASNHRTIATQEILISREAPRRETHDL